MQYELKCRTLASHEADLAKSREEDIEADREKIQRGTKAADRALGVLLGVKSVIGEIRRMRKIVFRAMARADRNEIKFNSLKEWVHDYCAETPPPGILSCSAYEANQRAHDWLMDEESRLFL